MRQTLKIDFDEKYFSDKWPLRIFYYENYFTPKQIKTNEAFKKLNFLKRGAAKHVLFLIFSSPPSPPLSLSL